MYQNDREVEAGFMAGVTDLFPLRSVQNGPVVHPASHPMSTGSSFPWGKLIEEWNWPFSSMWCGGWQYVQLYFQYHVRVHGFILNEAQALYRLKPGPPICRRLHVYATLLSVCPLYIMNCVSLYFMFRNFLTTRLLLRSRTVLHLQDLRFLQR
jgi:hypothetical protein